MTQLIAGLSSCSLWLQFSFPSFATSGSLGHRGLLPSGSRIRERHARYFGLSFSAKRIQCGSYCSLLPLGNRHCRVSGLWDSLSAVLGRKAGQSEEENSSRRKRRFVESREEARCKVQEKRGACGVFGFLRTTLPHVGLLL